MFHRGGTSERDHVRESTNSAPIASAIEPLEARRLLSAVTSPGDFAAAASAAAAGHHLKASTAQIAITGLALPTNHGYLDVPFFGPLAQFSSVPPVTPGDPMAGDPSVKINWGDGTPPTVIPASKIAAGLDSAGMYQAGAPHVYSVARSFGATISFFEGRKLKARVKQLVVVSTASAGGVTAQATVDQDFSGVVGTFSGFGQMVPADVTGGITIDWGDGQTSTGTVSPLGNETYQVSGTHAYSIPGAHPVQFSASFNIANSSTTLQETIDSSIFVHRPHGSARPPRIAGSGTVFPGFAGIVAGESESASTIDVSFTGVPYEQSAVSQYSATVRFSGEATQPITPLSFVDTGALNLTVNVPTFQKPGKRTAVIRLYRDEQQIGQLRVPIVVTLNSTPSTVESDSPLGGTGVTIKATAGRPFMGSLGTFTYGDDLGGMIQDPVSAVSIQWGDGTTAAGSFSNIGSSGEISPGLASVLYSATGTHIYATPGRYRVRVLASSSGIGPSISIDDTAIVRNG